MESSYDKAGRGMKKKDGPLPSGSPFGIPGTYGDNRIVLMVRDPWTLFSYWEISPEEEKKVLERMRTEGGTSSKRVLRVKEVLPVTHSTGKDPFISSYDLGEAEDRRYINTGKQGGSWRAEVGLLSAEGKYYRIAVSNTVTAPGHSISGDTGVEDMSAGEDLYREMLEHSRSRELGKSSPGFKERIDRHLRKWLSSGRT